MYWTAMTCVYAAMSAFTFPSVSSMTMIDLTDPESGRLESMIQAHTDTNAADMLSTMEIEIQNKERWSSS